LKSRLIGVPPGIHLPFDFAQGKRGCLAGLRRPPARLRFDRTFGELSRAAHRTGPERSPEHSRRRLVEGLAEALTAVRPFASNSFDGMMQGVPVPWLEL